MKHIYEEFYREPLEGDYDRYELKTEFVATDDILVNTTSMHRILGYAKVVEDVCEGLCIGDVIPVFEIYVSTWMTRFKSVDQLSRDIRTTIYKNLNETYIHSFTVVGFDLFEDKECTIPWKYIT